MTTYLARVAARARRCPRCGGLLTHHDADTLFRDYLACERCADDTYDPITGAILWPVT
jgi:ribosomal protein S27AE